KGGVPDSDQSAPSGWFILSPPSVNLAAVAVLLGGCGAERLGARLAQPPLRCDRGSTNGNHLTQTRGGTPNSRCRTGTLQRQTPSEIVGVLGGVARGGCFCVSSE